MRRLAGAGYNPGMKRLSERQAWALVGLAAALVVMPWLALTPPGLLGKADAIGYAVCHRIEARSFHLGERPLPLCARCTGMYLGAVAGVVTLMALGRGGRAGLPRWPVLLALGGLIGVMGVDGVNSYLTFFPNAPTLYAPNNTLRLLTGTLAGVSLGALVWPAVNQVLWAAWDPRPALTGWREVGLLVAAALGVTLAVLTEDPAVLYPLALVSAGGVWALLAALHLTIGVMLTGGNLGLTHPAQAVRPWLWASLSALAQIALIDAGRYAVFGTWAGFNF